MQWPSIGGQVPVRIPTAAGEVHVQLARVSGADMLVITSAACVDVPLVRFQSACVFGEGLRAVDCDCGAQLDSAIGEICAQGGVVTYGWEEGRGLGIAAKMEAIVLQQTKGMSTADAFARLGHKAEPRDFANHIAALRLVFGGSDVRLASANPTKIAGASRCRRPATGFGPWPRTGALRPIGGASRARAAPSPCSGSSPAGCCAGNAPFR